jgi:formylglycine-generating enzyme required for sulfatase activity
MVKAGPLCVDKYEASVWSSPTGGTQLVSEAQIDAACPNNGQSCEGTIFARSVAGVAPARDITWFQAVAALANSGKRLPTNGEWQMAVAGTPDPGGTPGSEDCNTNSAGVETTGQRTNCVSNVGANDMVGNLGEWVDDWDEQQAPANCSAYSGSTGFPGDRVCIGDDGASGVAALIRGGDYDNGDIAGALSVDARVAPFNSSATAIVIGFRGAR